jgi:hypothetical protein
MPFVKSHGRFNLNDLTGGQRVHGTMGTLAANARCLGMNDSDPKTSYGLVATTVVLIAVVGMVAAIYLLVVVPGLPIMPAPG